MVFVTVENFVRFIMYIRERQCNSNMRNHSGTHTELVCRTVYILIQNLSHCASEINNDFHCWLLYPDCIQTTCAFAKALNAKIYQKVHLLRLFISACKRDYSVYRVICFNHMNTTHLTSLTTKWMEILE